MKRVLIMGIASLFMLNMAAGGTLTAAASNGPSSVKFDFETDNAGFTPIYADYPYSEGVEEFYEFQHDYSKVPIDGAGNGIFISGNNHSDDLFMGYVKALEGFSPAKTYHFAVSFKLATDVEGGLVGVGGSPGESVVVKCGVTQTEPAALPVESGGVTYVRLNIDAGRQSNSGRDMVVVGNMTKAENNRPGAYEFKELTAEFDTAANVLGKVYLVIGTDSAFESTTSYYLDDISVTWGGTAQQPAVTRAQAAQMLWNAAGRPGTDPANCPFRDVSADNPNIEAITWTQGNGYLGGYGNGLFGPEDQMTVEQAMVMLYRFSKSPAADQTVLDRYEDGGQVSAWAKNAVSWTITIGAVPPNGSITPQALINVEELAACLDQIVVAC